MPGVSEQPASRSGVAVGAAAGRAAVAFGPASLAGSWLLAKAYMAHQHGRCTTGSMEGPAPQAASPVQAGAPGAAL